MYIYRHKTRRLVSNRPRVKFILELNSRGSALTTLTAPGPIVHFEIEIL